VSRRRRLPKPQGSSPSHVALDLHDDSSSSAPSNSFLVTRRGRCRVPDGRKIASECEQAVALVLRIGPLSRSPSWLPLLPRRSSANPGKSSTGTVFLKPFGEAERTFRYGEQGPVCALSDLAAPRRNGGGADLAQRLIKAHHSVQIRDVRRCHYTSSFGKLGSFCQNGSTTVLPGSCLLFSRNARTANFRRERALRS
jgi:hypothetical protein